MIKSILKVFGVFLAGLLTLVGTLYLQSEWYTFEISAPFSGDTWYNPYEGCSGKPLLGNFHAHSNAWHGLTNGAGSVNEVVSVYSAFDFDFASVSDYHKISDAQNVNCIQPASYEHGYGVFKNHQLIIGAKDITWFDFPFFQGVSQKQFIINRIRSNSADAVICLAHPSLRSAYTESDLQRLSGYDCFEALNKLRKSFDLWDASLSSGCYSYILGSDDVHNYRDIGDIGRCGTVVFAEESSEHSILTALKQGHHYAIEFPHRDGWDISERARALKRNPQLIFQRMQSDTLVVQFSEKASSISVYSDNHQILATAKDTSKIVLCLPHNATFARVEGVFSSGHTIYLNPVARTIDQLKPGLPLATFNF
ncbi:MAG: hypothetical protein RL226_263, partial [Bacteroidota bacterium]